MQFLSAMVVAVGAVGGGETVLLDFHAEWCGPCRQMQPVVAELTEAGLPVRRVDVDRDPAIAKKYRVEGIPCFVMLVNGEEVDREVGVTSGERLRAMLARGGGSRGEAKTGTRGSAAARGATAPLVPVAARGHGGSAAADVASEGATANDGLLDYAVRLKIDDGNGNSVGSGTIVDVRGNEALVLTCGHLFRDSSGKGPIRIDLFGSQTARGIPAELVSYDLERDVALVKFRSERPLQAARIAPPDYRARVGDAVYTVGCSHGADATVRPCRVASLDKYLGPPNLQVTGQPVQGRSGGGLFTKEGYVVGVCNAADPEDDEGLFAALGTVYAELDEAGLAHVYEARPEPAVVADAGSAARSGTRVPDYDVAASGAVAPGPARTPAMADAMPPADHLRRAAGSAMETASTTIAEPANRAARGGAGSVVLAAGERAALAELRERVGDGAEVICIVRPIDNPRAKSEIIVLDRASGAFLDQLTYERSRQSARFATSHHEEEVVDRTAKTAASRPDASDRGLKWRRPQRR